MYRPGTIRLCTFYGKIYYQNDKKSKLAAVGKLTKKMEERTNGETAWRMADAPRDYLNALLEHIVAFRIEITKNSWKIQGKPKPGPAIDFDNVANVLAEQGLHSHVYSNEPD